MYNNPLKSRWKGEITVRRNEIFVSFSRPELGQKKRFKTTLARSFEVCFVARSAVVEPPRLGRYSHSHHLHGEARAAKVTVRIAPGIAIIPRHPVRDRSLRIRNFSRRIEIHGD